MESSLQGQKPRTAKSLASGGLIHSTFLSPPSPGGKNSPQSEIRMLFTARKLRLGAKKNCENLGLDLPSPASLRLQHPAFKSMIVSMSPCYLTSATSLSQTGLNLVFPFSFVKQIFWIGPKKPLSGNRSLWQVERILHMVLGFSHNLGTLKKASALTSFYFLHYLLRTK